VFDDKYKQNRGHRQTLIGKLLVLPFANLQLGRAIAFIREVEFNPGGIPQIRWKVRRVAKFVAKYRQIISYGWHSASC
jgi:hypothetical protein